MKFSTREDKDAPIDTVFEAITDFEGFERSAMRRGATVRRTDQLAEPATGMTWDATFQLRGRQRRMQLELVKLEGPDELAVHGKSKSIDVVFQVELMALSRQRTRMSIGTELKPLNLSARLLIQSLKLPKNKLNKRFKGRVAEYVKALEYRISNVS